MALLSDDLLPSPYRWQLGLVVSKIPVTRHIGVRVPCELQIFTWGHDQNRGLENCGLKRWFSLFSRNAPSVMEWSRLCWQNFWYLSKSVQFLMLNKTRVVPSLKNFLGYPGRGCFGQNFHKKSQNFFLLESALCWTLYREKIWSSASFHQISSKSMQQY